MWTRRLWSTVCRLPQSASAFRMAMPKCSMPTGRTSIRIPKVDKTFFQCELPKLCGRRVAAQLSCTKACLMQSVGSNQAAKAWRLGAVLGALALVGCAPQPQPVHFFADGRPAKLSDWQVLYLDGGDLALADGVVPYDLNTPPLQRLRAQTAHDLDAARKIREIQCGWRLRISRRHHHHQDILLPAAERFSPRPESGGSHIRSVCRLWRRSRSPAAN